MLLVLNPTQTSQQLSKIPGSPTTSFWKARRHSYRSLPNIQQSRSLAVILAWFSDDENNMRKPWADSSSREDLDDVHLDDTAHLEDQRQAGRPECLQGPVQELFLALVAAFIGATFLILQRAMMLMTQTIRHSMWLDMSTTIWITASSA